ncbi:hypothetical protein H2203_003727 [Taxawa tesnikishii (nom. ined.)]|nr:hypothetical protein H2203_003727 [Dothideales sp. JES 119]
MLITSGFRDTREVRRDLESELEESLESSNQPAEAVTERKRKHHDSPERGEQRAAKTQNRSQETSARSATQSIPSATERSQQMQTQQPPGGGSSAAASAHHSGPGISHAAATSRANLNSTALVTQPTSTQQKPPPDPKEQFMAWGHSLFNDSGCVFRTSEKYTLEQVTNAKYVGPIELYPETKTMMRVMVQVIERACDDAHDTNLTLGMKVNKTTSWDGKRLDLDFKNMSARQYLESVSQKSYDTALNDLRQFSALLGKSEEVYYYQASFWKPLLDRRIQVEPAVNAKESDVQIRNRVVKAFAKEAGVPIRNNIGHELHRVANILHDLRTGATDHTWLILYGGKPFFEKLKNTARLTVDVVRKWADLYRPLVNRITVRIASLRRNSLMIPNRIVCALESVLAVHANFPPVQDRSRYRSYWHEDQRLTGPLYLARELTGTADVHSVVTDLVVARGKLLRVNAGRTSTLLRWGFQGATKKNHALLTDIVRMRDDGGRALGVLLSLAC